MSQPSSALCPKAELGAPFTTQYTSAMTRPLRHTLALFLALMLSVTSVGFAQARHQAMGAESFVICTGYGLVQISIDANGNPVERTVPCPDCVVTTLALVAQPIYITAAPVGYSAQFWPIHTDRHTPSLDLSWHSARAPPVSLV